MKKEGKYEEHKMNIEGTYLRAFDSNKESNLKWRVPYLEGASTEKFVSVRSDVI